MRILPYRIDHQAHNEGVLTVFPNSNRPQPPTLAERLGENQTHTILTFLNITNIIKKL